MSDVVLTELLLAKLAGWDVIKNARNLVAGGKVASSEWQSPWLRGVVGEGAASLRTGLKINGASDAENLCPCRDSRQRGLICAHAVAAGLHFIKSEASAKVVSNQKATPSTPSPKIAKKILRVASSLTGEPLQIHLILPPNLSEAIAKGKVMVYAEGTWCDGTAPLNALPFDRPFSLSPQDLEVLNALESLNEGDTPAMLLLNNEKFAALLPKLILHPRITLGRTLALRIEAKSLSIPLKAALNEDGTLTLKLKSNLPAGVIRGESSWVLNGNIIQPLTISSDMPGLLNGPLKISRAQIPQFLNVEWPKLTASPDVEANFDLDDFVFAPAQPKFKLELAGGMAMLSAELNCFYGNKKILVGRPSDAEFWMPDEASPFNYYMRDLASESFALARLTKYGFMGPDNSGKYNLKNQNQILQFFALEFPKLQTDWEVTLEARLQQSTEKNLERITPQFNISSSGEEWFNLDVSYGGRSGESFSATDVQRLLLSGQSHTRLKNGKFALLDTGAIEDFQNVLTDCAPRQIGGKYQFSNAQSGFLESSLRQQPGGQIHADTHWLNRAAQQSGALQMPIPDLGDLQPVLRPYQAQGVAWLEFLKANKFGGILADEMGLGKTLQVLAYLKSNIKPSGKPSLVVCPTSLVYNWGAEAQKFTPAIKTLLLHGGARENLFAKIPDHDLIVTSYTLLRRDIEQYRALEFDTIILDEAQHIKNRQTQNAQAVKLVRADHRFVLTGTPMENSVLDLWSIFDFLMPGYLGSAADFKERYEMPITKSHDKAVQNRLARRLRPFMLRRLKKEVATDLPAKIEQVTFCDLNDPQKALYQQVLDASRREITAAVGGQGLQKSRMLVLTALLRLRQICCDLRLLKLPEQTAEKESPNILPNPPEPAARSGKVELFMELLDEALDGGHRVLVFSQFTTMLACLKAELEQAGINFCQLDGTTKNRGEVVEKFQRDSAIPVFLISLKAGGVGLNLTGADTVIHFDPWWNPAVEAQATDRAHRIGQKKVVTSYKLITRGTVEEKILNLQNRKKSLIQSVIGGEDEFIAALDWQEIQELLTE